LKKEKAEEIMNDIKSKVNEWKNIADKYAILKSEQTMMEKSFRV